MSIGSPSAHPLLRPTQTRLIVPTADQPLITTLDSKKTAHAFHLPQPPHQEVEATPGPVVSPLLMSSHQPVSHPSNTIHPPPLTDPRTLDPLLTTAVTPSIPVGLIYTSRSCAICLWKVAQGPASLGPSVSMPMGQRSSE